MEMYIVPRGLNTDQSELASKRPKLQDMTSCDSLKSTMEKSSRGARVVLRRRDLSPVPETA